MAVFNSLLSSLTDLQPMAADSELQLCNDFSQVAYDMLNISSVAGRLASFICNQAGMLPSTFIIFAHVHGQLVCTLAMILSKIRVCMRILTSHMHVTLP